MPDFYTNYMDRYKKPKEVNDAIILSPNQINSFKKFLDITQESIKNEQSEIESLRHELDHDLEVIEYIEDKVNDLDNNPRVFTLMEGLLLVSLMMTFKYSNYDTDMISDDLEYIAENIETLFHEKGYLQMFYILKENKLS